jgi:hypothetical protein
MHWQGIMRHHADIASGDIMPNAFGSLSSGFQFWAMVT